MTEYDIGLRYVISSLRIESLGSYIIKWPEDLTGQTYHETAVVSVTLNEDADIVSKSLFKPLENELDSVAFDIIEKGQSEFRSLKRDSCIIPTIKGKTYLINVEFDKYE